MSLNINFAPIIKAAEARREALEKADAAYSEFIAAAHSLQSVRQAFERMYEAYINLDGEGQRLLVAAVAHATNKADRDSDEHTSAVRSRLGGLYNVNVSLRDVLLAANRLMPKE